MGEAIKMGGGATKGVYVWKKSRLVGVSYSVNTLDFSSGVFYNIPVETSFTVYVADSYTLDEDTRVFTLNNPTAYTINEVGLINIYKKYAIVNAPSTRNVMFTSDNSVYAPYFSHASGYLQMYTGSSNKILTQVFTVMNVDNKEFIGYITSNREDKYPEGGVHTDGYMYEKLHNWFDLEADKVQTPITNVCSMVYTPLADTKYIPKPTFIKYNCYISIERADEDWSTSALSRSDNVNEILAMKRNYLPLPNVNNYIAYTYKVYHGAYGHSYSVSSSVPNFNFTDYANLMYASDAYYLAGGKPYLLTYAK